MAGAARRLVRVRFTDNFARNLEEIEAFLRGSGMPRAFTELVRRLFEDAVANLRRFPRLGTDFAARDLHSAEAIALHRRLLSLLGKDLEVREYHLADYILLYAHSPRRRAVYLLCIRHHRQLSFDFGGHWN